MDELLLESEIRRIVAVAEPLENRWEQIERFELDETLLVSELMESWLDKTAESDTNRFEFRLSLDKIDERAAVASLKTIALLPSEELPSWGRILMMVIRCAATIPVTNECASATNPKRVQFPFEEIFAPFARVGMDLVTKRAKSHLEVFTDKAKRMVESFLFYRLHGILGLPLTETFFQFRSEIEKRTFNTSGTECPRQDSAYSTFISSMLSRSLLSFCVKYPTAVRMAAVVLEIWVENYVTLLQRLNDDRDQLQSFEGVRLEAGCVAEIDMGTSDSHNKGKTVAILKFQDGKRLVYKPRGLGIDVAHNELLKWLNNRGIPFPLKGVRVLDRGDYGWTEFIEYRTCQSKEEAERFFRNSGSLLCLLSILGANDSHKKNLIAKGEHPFLIDIETLLQPSVKILGEHQEVFRVAGERIRDSVLRVGLLPTWFISRMKDRPDTAFDLTGLGGIDESEDVLLFPQWENVNSDKMELNFRPGKTHLSKNAVFQDGILLQPTDFVEEIIDGYTQTYEFLVEIKEELLSKNSPMSGFRNRKIRVVLRNTSLYTKMLYKLSYPNLSKDGGSRSIELDILSRTFTEKSCTPKPVAIRYWAIFDSERAAMNIGDVPFFTANTDSTSLFLSEGGRKVTDFFVAPSFLELYRRIENLSEHDLARNVEFIKGSLFSRGTFVEGKRTTSFTRESRVKSELDEQFPLEEKEVFEVAKRIAESIRERAVRSQDGGSVWIYPYFAPLLERYQLGVTNLDLYAGSLGIGLFLATYGNLSGSDEFEDLARGSFLPVTQLTRHKDSLGGLDADIGGGVGLGSTIYSLVKAGEQLKDPSFYEVAIGVSRLLLERRVRADRFLDVISGSAGAILGLRLLYDKTKDDDVLRRMIMCGDHLLESRTNGQGGNSPRAWPTLKGKLNSGFAHGAAGISYSLTRLFDVTGNERYLSAALEGIEYEDSLYVAEIGNWLDVRGLLRDKRTENVAWGWCNGAPGIALGRLGMWHVLDRAFQEERLVRALDSVLTHSTVGPDDLCCGRIGRTEAFLFAGDQLQRKFWHDTALNLAKDVLLDARKNGEFDFGLKMPRGIFCPSLFKGTAGIGYQLLRLLKPSRVSCLLLWQ